jgi:hypothetical protein
MSDDERMSPISYITANPEVGVQVSSNLRAARCGRIIAT